ALASPRGDVPVMRPIIATFARPGGANAFASWVERELGVATRAGTVSAYGEAHDGYRLIVAWVADEQELDARDMARDIGAILHDAPIGARQDRRDAEG